MLPATNTTAAAARPLIRNVPLVVAARDALLVYRKRISSTSTLSHCQGTMPERISKASSSGLRLRELRGLKPSESYDLVTHVPDRESLVK